MTPEPYPIPTPAPKQPWNIPGITWAIRQWLLIVVFFAGDYLCMTEQHFAFLGKWRLDPELGGIWAPATPMEFCGPILWMMPLGIASYLMTTLTLHLHFRNTIDKDINSGAFIAYWEAASSDLKLKLVFAAIIGLALVYAILFAGLARA